ncbi:MAG: ferredoxin [Chromatiales bacterium]|jgi:ferredoxin|nr:ferredoxin [Chromatiales bacterium]
MPLHIKIDRGLCSGYALCIDAAPEVFDMDENDVAVVVMAEEALEGQRDAIECAAKLCPRKAITIDRVN